MITITIDPAALQLLLAVATPAVAAYLYGRRTKRRPAAAKKRTSGPAQKN